MAAVAPTLPFSEPTRRWFAQAFGTPTPAQAEGWPAIARGEHVLICAPTGSGKTLAAFLAGIDRLFTEPPAPTTRLLYVSPLKALNYDVERNLRGPLAGIKALAAAHGEQLRVPTVAVRTGDTPQDARRRMLREPPDILITTPESLYLMLTSRQREMLAGVESVIVDEIHAVASTKRGAHLMLSLERLAEQCERDPQRIALSATQRPLEEVARLVGGDRPVTIVDAGVRKELDLRVVVPLEDLGEPDGMPEVKIQDVQGATDGGPRSIWPAVYPELLELVRAHRSTLVFVNSRRLAERLALRLNELAEEPIARAHHGSVSREARVEIEEALKSGDLPCLVATSSLELGIDMGAIDLVVQVESPGSVARGLQRIGRAGHQVGEPSRGRVFPKFRGDLVECAVVVERMHAGQIEETRVPRNPLDVLCQQIVAICAERTLSVDELYALVRRAYPYRDLPRTQLEGVLDMLAGRYPSDEFAELRPRLVWDRVEGTVRARDGAGRVAIANAGTIPDRGLFGVFLADGGGRVGELDEEMVYEAREGQVFLLGASSWRIEEITRDRVIVSPAPGAPGAIPFWKGEEVGRPAELGGAIGAFCRDVAALSDERAVERLMAQNDCDERAARNVVSYLREQEAATGIVPSDRALVAERFRDEIGDWRLCLLSPYGGRVHAPWALALGALLRREHGLESQSVWSDDGIILHLPDSDTPPDPELVMIDPDAVEDLLVGELGGSALYGARFRENAARALLIPRRRPGQRTPLWQQRLKAQSLLQVAERYGSFPIVLETYRELLQDHFDLDALRSLLAAVRRREISLVPVETEHASPFARSLTFDYVARYMYEDDTPAAERRVQALTLDRDLLRELLGSEELRDLLDPGSPVRGRARPGPRSRRGPGRGARPAAARRRPDPRRAARAARGRRGRVARLPARRPPGPARAAGRRGAGDRRRGLRPLPRRAGRDASCRRAGGVPRSRARRAALGAGPLRPPPRAVHQRGRRVPLRPERRGGRGRAARPGGRREAGARQPAARLDGSRVVRPGRPSPDPAGLGRGPAQGGRARRAGRPGPLRARLARRRPRLARLARPPAGHAGRAAGPPAGSRRPRARRAPAARARVPPGLADALCSGGELVWVGVEGGKVALLFRDEAALLGPPPGAAPAPAGESHAAVRAALAAGPRFFSDLVAETGLPQAELLAALFDLAWAGEVTNDAFAPLRSPRAARGAAAANPRPAAAGRRLVRRRQAPSGAAQGRWSLAGALFAGPPAERDRQRALAELLLERHGVVTRAAVQAEGLSGGFGAVYGALRDLETLGACRRGYFVAGAGGAQFALAGAVERLRELRDPPDQPDTVVLAASDPANPYGSALPWPARAAGRASRSSGAYVVLDGGVPALFAERGGRTLLTLDDDQGRIGRAVLALAAEVQRGRPARLGLERIDGEAAIGSPLEPVLRGAGFLAGPRRLTLRAPRA